MHHTIRRAAIALLCAASMPASTANAEPPATPAPRIVHVATVHLDGNAGIRGSGGHPPEAFPESTLPAGGGLTLTPPGEDGAWRVRMFAFVPSEIVAVQGERLRLVFVGVQGPSHRIRVGDGEPQRLLRGATLAVDVDTSRPGRIHFESIDRAPSMRGSVLVVAAD